MRFRRALIGGIGACALAISLTGILPTVPSAGATTVTTNYAYVANNGSGSVSVVNLTTDAVVDTISGNGLSSPVDVAATPNGAYVYVTNQGSDTVSVISTATNTITATVTVGFQPWGIAVSPNGQDVYVANYNGDNSFNSSDPKETSVSVIATATNTVVATIGLGAAFPEGLAVSPSGDYVYVADYGTSAISVISTATNSVVRTVTTGAFTPVSVGVEPDGKYVYFGDYQGDLIGMLSVSGSGPSADTFSTLSGLYMTQITAFAFNSTTVVGPEGQNGSYAEYFPWGQTSVSYTNVPAIQGLSSPLGAAVSPDGSTFYVTSYNLNNISVLPASSLVIPPGSTPVSPTATIPVGVGPEGIAIVALTQSQNSITVTSTAPGHAVVGGQTYTPSATATSGDTVTIGLDATSTGCSINGSGVVSFTGVGTCVIDFNDAGNANYAAATPVQQSFSVGQGTNEVAQVGRWATVLPSGADSTAVMSASRIGGSAKGCVVRGDHVTAAGAGTCVVLEIVRESSGSGTTSMVITVDFHARARVEGVRPDVVRQTTQTIVIVGQGLFGTPRVTSRGAGIRATIVRATPKELVVRVSRSPSASRGLHILRLVLPDGQVLTVRYVIA